MEKLKEINVGDLVQDKLDDWHIVTYIYGDEEIVGATGLGKHGSYPISVGEITNVKKCNSAISQFLGDKISLWMTVNADRMVVVVPPKIYPHRLFSEFYYKVDLLKNFNNEIVYGIGDHIGFLYQLNELIKYKEYDPREYNVNVIERNKNLSNLFKAIKNDADYCANNTDKFKFEELTELEFSSLNLNIEPEDKWFDGYYYTIK